MTEEQPEKERENVYFVDTESTAEKARLIQQGRLITNSMGGLLVEQADVKRFHRVLDAACGPGEWALDLAFANPEMEVVGIDISQHMTEIAFEQARIQSIENVRFQVMDITRPLDFPANSFDLINARTIVGIMPRLIWPEFIRECSRILRPHGILRLTECDTWGITNSPAFEAYNDLALLASQRAGVGFSPNGGTFTITPMLKRLLQNASYSNIQEKSFFNNFSFGEKAHQGMYKTLMAFFQLAQPAFIKYGVGTKETLDQLYQQMLLEMQATNFCGINFFLTVWGERP